MKLRKLVDELGEAVFAGKYVEDCFLDGEGAAEGEEGEVGKVNEGGNGCRLFEPRKRSS